MNLSNSDKSLKSYINRIVVNTRNRTSFNCLQFTYILYTDHKLVAYKMYIDKIHR